MHAANVFDPATNQSVYDKDPSLLSDYHSANISDLPSGKPDWYGALDYRTAARTLFLRPYLAHFCSFFRRVFAVLSALTPGFQKVALEDRGPVP